MSLFMKQGHEPHATPQCKNMDHEDDVDVQDEIIHENAHDYYDECIIDKSLDDNNKNIDLAKIPQSNPFSWEGQFWYETR